jgi:hypothetical protein
MYTFFMNMQKVISLFTVLTLAFMFGPALAGNNVSFKERNEEEICSILNEQIRAGKKAKQIVRTSIQMGYNACSVIKCAIKAGGNIEQIVSGAVESGSQFDLVSRCAIDAGIDGTMIAPIFPQLCMIE